MAVAKKQKSKRGIGRRAECEGARDGQRQNEKEDRPIGILTTEDKILQRVAVMILEPVYLHEVLNKWFVESVQPECEGRTFMVRYADDFVMGFERLADVHKVQRVIAKRFARFWLKINTEKTRLVRFGRPSQNGGTGDKPETFDFFGFTHYWGKSRKDNQVVQKKTAAGRFRVDDVFICCQC